MDQRSYGNRELGENRLKVPIRDVGASKHVPYSKSSGHPFGPDLEAAQRLEDCYLRVARLVDPVLVIGLGQSLRR
ncbi:hypothetical protein N7528_002825 [Penicillium herquei]|nr:hypothetical protein N7528_002825 [Penicillium herquei]